MHGRGDPAIIAHGNLGSAGAAQQGGEAAADRAGIVGPEGFADDAADIVFAQDRGVELVGHAGTPAVMH